MKKFLNLLIVVLTIVSTLFTYSNISLRFRNNTIDSLNNKFSIANSKLTSENAYLRVLLRANSIDNINYVLPIGDAYDISDTSRLKPIKLFNKPRDKKFLVIRYTAIGCNSCVDMLFKILNNSNKINNKYDIIVLANYTDYVYFIRWFKVSEVRHNVLYLEKGSLNLTLENDHDSYVFVVDVDNKVSSIFIPNNLFPEYTEMYLQNILL